MTEAEYKKLARKFLESHITLSSEVLDELCEAVYTESSEGPAGMPAFDKHFLPHDVWREFYPDYELDISG